MAAQKKLQVKDLKVSFKTINGKVQAVRDISFDLYEGETLAIVGESGSGKSVTNRAILGISAPNAIIESGEVIYDGKDLLKISEDEFYHIRGDKISMIFQDPLSSLNPIVKIGKQLTEAMLLKGKANQRDSRRQLNYYFKWLGIYFDKAKEKGRLPQDANTAELMSTCKKILIEGSKFENTYYMARKAANNGIKNVSDLLFVIGKGQVKDMPGDVREILQLGHDSMHQYVVSDPAMKDYISQVKQAAPKAQKTKDFGWLVDGLESMLRLFREADAKAQVNSFARAYYDFAGNNTIDLDAPNDVQNDNLEAYLRTGFMDDFEKNVAQALRTSDDDMVENRKAAIAYLDGKLAELSASGSCTNQELTQFEKESAEVIEKGINPLHVIKSSPAYTYRTSIGEAVRTYISGKKNNASEQARFESQTKKYNALVEAGKAPEWKVVPANIVDTDAVFENIINIAQQVNDDFKTSVDVTPDFDEAAREFVRHLEGYSAGVVHRVTKTIAKNRAIKLMEEVGIPEPRRRYKQYPFEFSGGMRQRIVIAIALSADPDILICDEPTTALDVTIQSQILELINRIKKARNVSVIFITHDLGVVANMADRVAVMYAGKIVEIGTADEIFYEPAHPYTWALLSSMPDLDTKEKLDSIPGTPPNMIYPPVGDAFADRNKYAVALDFKAQPPLFKITDTHYAATWLRHPQAPHVDPPKSVVDRIARMKARMAAEEVNSNE